MLLAQFDCPLKACFRLCSHPIVFRGKALLIRTGSLVIYEALHELASASAHKSGEFPALKLTDLCLELSTELLEGKPPTLNGPMRRRVTEMLKRAACVKRVDPCMSLAFATLHFVERMLGLTVVRGKRQHHSCLLVEESRQRTQKCGTYGTPEFISTTMVQQVLENFKRDGTSPATILDMSVEAGQFAVTFLAHASQMQRLRFYALDRDPAALAIAQRIVHFAGNGSHAGQFQFHTSCRNSLIDQLPPSWPAQFSAVIGNPPWKEFAGDKAEGIRQHFPAWLTKGRYDVFLAFIARADSLLAPGGYLNFVVPSTFLFNLGAASNVRQLLLERYEILELTVYPQGSFVELSCVIPVSFLARKRSGNTRSPLSRITYHPTPLGGETRPRSSHFRAASALWKQLPGSVFHPAADRSLKFLCAGLPGHSLCHWGDLIGGVHLAGQKKQKPSRDFKGIHARHIRAFHVCTREAPIYSAAEARFEKGPHETWIRSNKVVIQEMRYMTHRDRLVAARAGRGTCAVSTASMFFPRDARHCDFFEALLNSQLANAWYKLRDVSRSIKLIHLRKLPVPFDSLRWKQIAALGRHCRSLRSEFHRQLSLCTISNENLYLQEKFGGRFRKFLELRNKVETVVFDLYRLSAKEREAVRKFSEARVF